MNRSRLRNPKQGGYVLLAILFALTVLIIGLAVAAPSAATALRRTKEEELVRRGQQYALGIRRFYKKFGRYPSSLDQLENTNNIRFIRRRYLDPLTGKDDWTPIQFGQARPALGFFGQKVINTSGQSPSGPGLGPSTIGTGLGGGSGSGSSSLNNPSSATPSNSQSGGSSVTGPSGTASPGTPAGPSGTASSATPAGPSGSAGNPLSSDQLSGRSFGGGSIVGVSVPSEKESLKEYQQKNHYNEWQFVYDPTMDPTLRGGAGSGAATGIPGAAGTIPGQGIGGLNPGMMNTPNSPNSPATNNPPPNNPMSPAMPK